LENQAPVREESTVGKGVVGWFIGSGILLLLYGAMGWLDNTTQLEPAHNNVDAATFCVAGLAGIVFCGAAISLSKKWILWRRIGFALAFLLLGTLLGFMVTYRAASIVEGLIDFPPAKTRSYATLLLISRAYQTHGKGESWNIQTMPIWSDLYITREDYNFMLAHRRPGDGAQTPDEISSKGYFCAQVTVEQSGNALRVMNAGSHKLPKGTVIECPAPAQER
jgi:hypothetical protein